LYDIAQILIGRRLHLVLLKNTEGLANYYQIKLLEQTMEMDIHWARV
jgi:hypothetical protein